MKIVLTTLTLALLTAQQPATFTFASEVNLPQPETAPRSTARVSAGFTPVDDVLAMRPVPQGDNRVSQPENTVSGEKTDTETTRAIPPAKPLSKPRPPNVLLLIGDDIGVEALKSYRIGTSTASTPVLDQLARNGMQFNNVWSQATCTPTRSTIMTGRYGFRTGVGSAAAGLNMSSNPTSYLRAPENAPIEHHEDMSYAMQLALPWTVHAMFERGEQISGARSGLPADEISLAARIKQIAPQYRTAAVGKWHLADSQNGGLKHPKIAGFDFYSVIHGKSTQYFSWQENVNGTVLSKTGYTPDQKVQTALDWIDGQDTNPWFMWFGFNLPHSPYFIPPSAETTLKPQAATTTALLKDSPEYFDLMVEEMDRKIGNLLSSLPDQVSANTVVIFVGDNGTSYEAIDPPFKIDQSKFTLFQGGIHVPLIISGPGIAQGVEIEAMVNSTDLFATVLDIISAGQRENYQQPPTDSVSLYPYLTQPDLSPLRHWLYADRLLNQHGIEKGDYAVRDVRYKLIGSQTWNEFYDLSTDRYESQNLLTGELTRLQKQALRKLTDIATQLHTSENYRTPGLSLLRRRHLD